MQSRTQQNPDVSSSKGKPKLASFFILTSIAVPLLAVGIIGLYVPEILPWPNNPTVAWSLIGVGAIMDVAAAVILVSELRRAQSR